MAEVATVGAYYTADRSRVVGEGDPDAAYLLVNAGSSLDGLSEADRKAYDNFAAGKVDTVQEYDAVADHAAKHGSETQAEADAAQQRMLAGEPDPDGPAVPG